jgi:RNA polymerase sigma factor (sigma-70 family)
MKNSVFGFSAGGYLSTKPMPADADLLQRYADDHSEDAFAELVRRHLDGVYSSALRRVGGDTHLAQDVAQAVFVALARQSRGLVSHPFLTAWLYATTRNEAANTVRRERRRKTREAAATAMNETNDSSSAESAANWSRLSPVLDDAIDQLSETDRAAILLRFIDRRPFAEIGANLRVTEDAARMRVDRALDKLRTLLTRRGITSTSAALGLVLANNAVAAAPISVATSVTLAAIGTIPATATAAVASAKIGTSAALSAKAYVGIAAITTASLGYFVFERLWSTPVSPISTASVAVAVPTKTPRVWPAEEAAVRAFLQRHPEVHDALHRLYHGRFKAKFGHLYRELRLSPEEISELQSLLCEGKIYSPDWNSSLKIPAGTGMPESEVLARMQSLLGPERHAAWKRRQRDIDTAIVREQIEKISANLVFTDAQLSPPQTARLVELLSRIDHPRNWDRCSEEARQFLSPRQFEAFLIVPAERKYGEALREFWNPSFGKTSDAQSSDSAARNRQFALHLETNDTALALRHAKEHTSLAKDYAPFYERVRLPHHRRFAFEKILIQNELAALRDNAMRHIPSSNDRMINSLLGDSDFKELQSFERVKLYYQAATAFAAHATWAKQSLTAAQTEKLAQLIIASKRQDSSLRPFVDWKNVEERSGDFLSSDQQELLKTAELNGYPRFALQLNDLIEKALEKDRLAGIPLVDATP